MPAATNGNFVQVANVNSGDRQYVHSYTVSYSTSPNTVSILFAGQINLYFRRVTDELPENAVAEASCQRGWVADVDMKLSKDDEGNSVIVLSHSADMVPSLQKDDSSENNEAKFLTWFLRIISDIAAFGVGGTFDLESVMGDLFSAKVSFTGEFSPNDIGAVHFIVPAGNVFFFNNPSVDSLGNLSIELSYKTDY